MQTVEIIFTSREKAREFIDWFCNIGEQYYWQDLENNGDVYAERLEYQFEHFRIVEERNDEKTEC